MRLLLAMILASTVTGCVSLIDVSKVKGDEAKPGLRYFLPQVFLKVTPMADGNITVDTVYLPDPAHEYAVDVSSFLGNYTIDMNRSEEGFLELVTFNSDSTGVAKQLISSQAALKATEIDTQASKAKADDAASKALADKQAVAIANADKAQKDAALALQIADKKLAVLAALVGKDTAPTNLKDQILSAQLAQSEAAVRNEAARLTLAAISTNMAAANGPDNQALTAPEPVFLKVVMEPTTVSLKMPFAQTNRNTWKIPTAGPSAADFAVRPAFLSLYPADKTGALTGTVQSTIPMNSAALSTVRDKGTQQEIPVGSVTAPRSTLLFDNTTIRIDMPKAMPAGEYELEHQVYLGPKDNPTSKTVVITVRVEK